MSVVTAVTAQNSVSVQAVEWMSPQFIMTQLDAVLSDYGADAVKSGFLGRTEIIMAVSAKLQTVKPAHVVIDPVLVNHKQQAMFSDLVRVCYLAYLLPIADLITPNLTEAALLMNSSSLDSYLRIRRAAQELNRFGAKHVLIKGFRDGDEMVDIFYDGHTFTDFRDPFIESPHTHGAGDTLSAAVCTFLAQGVGMKTAVARAKQFTHQAIRKAANWQLGKGHGPLAHF